MQDVSWRRSARLRAQEQKAADKNPRRWNLKIIKKDWLGNKQVFQISWQVAWLYFDSGRGILALQRIRDDGRIKAHDWRTPGLQGDDYLQVIEFNNLQFTEY